MKTLLSSALAAAFWILLAQGSLQADDGIPTWNPAAVLGPASACADCRVLDTRREIVVGDIAHYTFVLQVGPEENDRIGLHRVVRERAPWQPIRARQGVMLAHGINVGFAGTFLAGAGGHDTGIEGAGLGHNLPAFLAARDVDVWGIDFRWVLVPGAATDLSFMAEWGLARSRADLGLALRAARIGRWLTGSGAGRIDLVGYSRGARISYAYLNHEAKQPRWRRQVGRFVHLDVEVKTDDPARAQAFCDRIEGVQAAIDAGDVADDIRFLGSLGQLAQAAPDDPSPVFPGFSNRQAALLVGTTPPGGSGTFHLFAGIFEEGLPTGLAYTDERVALGLLAAAASYQPLAEVRDVLTVLCDDGRSTFDDRYADITVPVLYVGAAGGDNGRGPAVFSRLGSSETAAILVRFLEPGQELFDVGHGDILTMPQAASLVWQPIFEWVTAG